MKRLAALPLLGLALLTACNGGDTTPPAVILSANVPELPGPVAYVADVADTGGVQRVEFYQAGTLVDTDTTAPYSTTHFEANVAVAGTLTAKAYDNAGNVGSATITVNHVAYEGFYFWAAFTDPTDWEGSTVADGNLTIVAQTPSDSGNVLGLGGYERSNPLPGQQGPAGIGIMPFEGYNYLNTVFLYDQAEYPLYVAANDDDDQFSMVDGMPYFSGQASVFNPDKSLLTNTYFLMVRVTSSLYGSAQSSAKAGRAALAQAGVAMKSQKNKRVLDFSNGFKVNRRAYQSAQELLNAR